MDKAENLEEFFLFIDSFSSPFHISQLETTESQYHLAVTITEALWKVIDYATFPHQFSLDSPNDFFRAFFQYHEKIFGQLDDSFIFRMIASHDHITSRIPVAGTLLLNYDLSRVLYVVQTGRVKTVSPPRGKRNKDETPIQTAIRECLEETGLDVTPFILENEYLTFEINRPIRLFIAVTPLAGYEKIQTPQRSLLDKRNTEISSLKWIDLTALGEIASIYINRAIPPLLYQWTQHKLDFPKSNNKENKMIFLRPICHSDGKVYHYNPAIQKQFNSINRNDHNAWDDLIQQNSLHSLTISSRFKSYMQSCANSLDTARHNVFLPVNCKNAAICYDVNRFGNQVLQSHDIQSGNRSMGHRDNGNGGDDSPTDSCGGGHHQRNRSPSGNNNKHINGYRDNSNQSSRSNSRNDVSTQQPKLEQDISLDTLFGPKGQTISLDELFSSPSSPATSITTTTVAKSSISPPLQTTSPQPAAYAPTVVVSSTSRLAPNSSKPIYFTAQQQPQQPQQPSNGKAQTAVLSTDQHYEAYRARQIVLTQSALNNTPTATIISSVVSSSPASTPAASISTSANQSPAQSVLLHSKLNSLKTQVKTTSVAAAAK